MQLSPALHSRPEKLGRLSMTRTSSWTGQRPTISSPITRKRGGRSAIVPRRHQLAAKENHHHGSPWSPLMAASSSPCRYKRRVSPQQDKASYHVIHDCRHSMNGRPRVTSGKDVQQLCFQKSKIPSPAMLPRESLLAKSVSSPLTKDRLTDQHRKSSCSAAASSRQQLHTNVNTAENDWLGRLPHSTRSLSSQVKIQHASDQLKETARRQREKHTLQSERIHSIMEWLFTSTGEVFKDFRTTSNSILIESLSITEQRVTMFMELNGFSGCFPMSLKSGKILCLLINRIRPHTIARVNSVLIPRLSKVRRDKNTSSH